MVTDRASNEIRTHVFDLASRRTDQLYYTCIWDIGKSEVFLNDNHS